jgi:hypothetical protein
MQSSLSKNGWKEVGRMERKSGMEERTGREKKGRKGRVEQEVKQLT